MSQKTELRGREYSRYGPSQTHSSDEAGVRTNLRSQTNSQRPSSRRPARAGNRFGGCHETVTRSVIHREGCPTGGSCRPRSALARGQFQRLVQVTARYLCDDVHGQRGLRHAVGDHESDPQVVQTVPAERCPHRLLKSATDKGRERAVLLFTRRISQLADFLRQNQIRLLAIDLRVQDRAAGRVGGHPGQDWIPDGCDD